MDNNHEVAVRPDGKQLYVYGIDIPLMVIVDIDSTDYPVIAKIDLPGRKAPPINYISFSRDSRYAYIARPIQCIYEKNCANFGDFTKIIVIDTAERRIARAIAMPQPYTPVASVIPSPDNKWLYFVAADFSSRRLGIGKLDLQSDQVVSFLWLESTNFVTMSSDGKYLYATQGWNLFGPPKNLFSKIDIKSFEVVSSVPVGNGPQYVAVTPDGQKAYVSNQWSNNVSAINLETMKAIATIDVGPGPRVIAVTPDGRKAYVALPGTITGMATYELGNAVAVIDVERDVVLSRLKVDLEPESIAMDPDGTRAYVSDGNANGSNPSEVHIIDTINDVYLRPIILRAPATYMPTAIDITPDGRRLFVVSEAVESTAHRRTSHTKLLAIDAITGATVGQLDIQPRGLKVSGDGQKVYVFSPQRLFIINSLSLEIIKSIDLSQVYPQYPAFYDQEAFRIVLNRAEDTAYLLGKSADVAVVNLTRGEVVTSVRVAEGPLGPAKGLALTPDGKKLFASDHRSQAVAVIDTSTNKVIARVPVGNLPAEIKISEDGKRAFVLQQLNSTTLMTIIDVDTHAVLRNIDFSGGIEGALDFEISSDEGYLYVACFDPNFVMVYDLNERKVVKAIAVGLDPFNMVSTTDGRLIYVTNFTTDDISVVDTATNAVVRTIKLDGSS